MFACFHGIQFSCDRPTPKKSSAPTGSQLHGAAFTVKVQNVNTAAVFGTDKSATPTSTLPGMGFVRYTIFVCHLPLHA